MDNIETIDMAAVARVSGRVSLQAIRLAKLVLEAPTLASPGNPLEAEFSQECTPSPSEKGTISVSCKFQFRVRTLGEEVGNIRAEYNVAYQLRGDEPPSENDLKHFAAANGAYHSWPFLRELIFGLTARIGYPPFMLPVISFQASAATQAVQPGQADDSGEP